MLFKRERSSYSPQLGDKDTEQNLSCPSSGSSRLLSPAVSKKTKESPEKNLSDIKIHVVQAKFSSSEVGELSAIVEDSGAIICSSPSDAEVLVTNIRMKKRLERHIGWSLAKEKAVVTPDWLRESARVGKALPCGEFVALEDLHDETVINCPESEDCSGCSRCHLPSPSSSPLTDGTMSRTLAVRDKKGKGKEFKPAPIQTPPSFSPSTGVYLIPTVLPTLRENLDYAARYACARASPMTCPNQALACELAIIRRSRELEGEQRSALSYQRAIGVVKAYPHRITSIQQTAKLPYIGAKIRSMVEEFIRLGRISAARDIATSTRFQSLGCFADVYGIGPVTARKLYDIGLRTIDDLRLYYGVNEGEEDVEIEDTQDEAMGIKVGLALYEDLIIKIPRDEVEEMARLVYSELCEIQSGCAYSIVGGYRRGKQESNDVDIVFTHPESGKDRGLCKKLVGRLREKGMITHVMHLSSFRSPSSIRKTQWDTLEKALTVFRLPQSSPYHEEHLHNYGRDKVVARRLDLIFAPVEVYWCAVIGWTGSTMFQRDIRQWTKDKRGWKFDSSGITHLADSSLVLAKSELEVFQMCGLEWIDPTMRNADA